MTLDIANIISSVFLFVMIAYYYHSLGLYLECYHGASVKAERRFYKREDSSVHADGWPSNINVLFLLQLRLRLTQWMTC
jgi:hypothetical protein